MTEKEFSELVFTAGMEFLTDDEKWHDLLQVDFYIGEICSYNGWIDAENVKMVRLKNENK